jgi:hypothetical protein
MQGSAQSLPAPMRLVPNKPGAAQPSGSTVTSGVNPFVRQLGLKEIEKRDAPPPPPVTDIDDIEAMPALVGHVWRSWDRNKLAKERISQNLLADLRARRGVYSSAELSNIEATTGGLNVVWAPLTDIKCRAGSAWIHDVALPVGDSPSGLEPTPVPDLPMPMKKGIVMKALKQAQEVMQQAEAAGGGVMDPDEFRALVLQLGDKLRDDAEKTYKKLAETRAKRMEKVIEDRKAEGNFYAAMSDFIEDFCTYPAAHLKGPIYKRNKQLKWGDGWRPSVTNDAIQWWDSVSPFDCYPAPGTMTPQKGDFIEHMRFQRDELYDLKGLDGFKDDQIDNALREYSEGRAENWLWTESERQRLEQETNYMWLSPKGVIDAINFWGKVPGWKLMTWGVSGIEEETRDYECNVLVVGRYVIYAALNPNPLGRRPYRKACYDAVPRAYWGRSIPNLVRTPQVMCNGAACAMGDNMGMASGPMMWTHVDRLADGEQSMEIFPWKNWQLKSDPTQGVNPGIGFFQAKSNVQELWATFEKWELKSDDASGIPRYSYGNERVSGAAATSSGLNTLLGQTAKGLRRAISDIDMNVFGPTTEDCFINEMLYNPDHSIKGDCRVVARGAVAILIRSEAQQRRLQFLGLTANEFDQAIVGGKYRAALLRETAVAMGLPDDCVPSEEDFTQEDAAKAQAQQQQQQQMLAIEAKREQTQFQHEVVLTQVKEEAIAAREQSARTHDMIGNIVEQAVQSALDARTAAQEAKATEGTAAKKPKKLKHTYDDAGNLAESILE